MKYVKEVDYFGIKIDSKLSWKLHLDNKIMKTKRCMLMCRNSLALINPRSGTIPPELVPEVQQHEDNEYRNDIK